MEVSLSGTDRELLRQVVTAISDSGKQTTSKLEIVADVIKTGLKVAAAGEGVGNTVPYLETLVALNQTSDANTTGIHGAIVDGDGVPRFATNSKLDEVNAELNRLRAQLEQLNAKAATSSAQLSSIYDKASSIDIHSSDSAIRLSSIINATNDTAIRASSIINNTLSTSNNCATVHNDLSTVNDKLDSIINSLPVGAQVTEILACLRNAEGTSYLRDTLNCLRSSSGRPYLMNGTTGDSQFDVTHAKQDSTYQLLTVLNTMNQNIAWMHIQGKRIAQTLFGTTEVPVATPTKPLIEIFNATGGDIVALSRVGINQ